MLYSILPLFHHRFADFNRKDSKGLRKDSEVASPQSCHPDVGGNPLGTPQTNFTHNLFMLNSIQHLNTYL